MFIDKSHKPFVWILLAVILVAIGLTGWAVWPAWRHYRAVQDLHEPNSDSMTRLQAAERLAQIGPNAISDLVDLLHDEKSEVRELAAIALGRMGPKAAPALDELLQMMRDSSPNVRKGVLSSMANIAPHDEAVLSALLDAISDTDASVRELAINLLGTIHPPEIPTLVAAMERQDPEVRKRLLDILHDLGPEASEAVPAIIAMTMDEDQTVQMKASLALTAIGSAAIPTLTQRLVEGRTEERATMAFAIVSIKARERMGFSGPTDRAIRFAEIIDPALWRETGLGPEAEAAIPALLEALRSDNSRTRWRAAHSLSIIGSPSVKPLAALLEHEDVKVRVAAAIAVTLIDQHYVAAVPCLIEALKDEDHMIREMVADRLYGLGPLAKDAVPTLIELLKDPNPNVAFSAAGALNKIDPDAAAKEVPPDVLRRLR